MTEVNTKRNAPTFGPLHVVEPLSKHTHTAIVLYGRGSTGEEIAGEFFVSTLSGERTLSEQLPGCRWVFPSAPELWSSVFQEAMPAWFEAHSLVDITAYQELQVDGIRDSVKYISNIIIGEIERLEGNSRRLLLGGISQGGAIVLWTLLCQQNSAMRPGAIFVTSIWLPFAANIERICIDRPSPDDSKRTEFDFFVQEMMMEQTAFVSTGVNQDSQRQTPVFVAHGIDDAVVDVELGRQAARIVSQIGMPVEWKEYTNAE